jgi:hypothetical protein
VSRLTRIVALVVLALWGLATVHCKLEGLPGLGFFKSCCLEESQSSAKDACGNDGCAVVEKGDYRTEEVAAQAPQPPVAPALPPLLARVPLWDLQPPFLAAASPPPEPARGWRFAHRAALLPRPPSIVS